LKIAISATGKDLNAMVDPRFGRCSYFILVEVEGKEIKGFEAIENPAATAMGGAGIQAAQTIANKGAEVVIAGNIGPNAFGVLSTSGIKVITGVAGISVKEAVERYLKGELRETSTPTTPGLVPGRPAGPLGPPGPTPGVVPGMGRGRGFGGPPAECVCPNCGLRVPHQRGIPCFQHICPKCGTPMVRG